MTTVITAVAATACIAAALLSFALVFADPDGWLLPTIVHTAGATAWLALAVLIQRDLRTS